MSWVGIPGGFGGMPGFPGESWICGGLGWSGLQRGFGTNRHLQRVNNPYMCSREPSKLQAAPSTRALHPGSCQTLHCTTFKAQRPDFLSLRRLSETPTPTGLRESTAMHLHFVQQCYASDLYRCTFRLQARETQQYNSHLYCSAPPICTAVRLPFVRQYFWESTGGWVHRKVPDSSVTYAEHVAVDNFSGKHVPKLRRTVLGSSRGPCYQRNLPMQGIICQLVVC